jgi:hypothetical protein
VERQDTDVDDLEISLDNQPGELARMGGALGAAGVSVEMERR